MTQLSLRTGQRGEKIAQSVLIRKGFRIEALNWRAGRIGEIDIIAYHPVERILVFVEVKTRKNTRFGIPAEAMTPRKQQQLLNLAQAYLVACSQPDYDSLRFDVISILYLGHAHPAEIEHIENAFGNSLF
jgi:putative endonuclease